MTAKGKPSYAPPTATLSPNLTGASALEAQGRATNGAEAKLPGAVANSWMNMLPGQQKKSMTGQ